MKDTGDEQRPEQGRIVMAEQADGSQDRTDEKLPQPDAERQVRHLRAAHAQCPAGFGRKVSGKLVSMQPRTDAIEIGNWITVRPQ